MAEEDFKNIMRSSQKEIPDEIIQKIKAIKNEFTKLIPKLAGEYNNEIPFHVIKEHTGYEYQIISDVILNLIIEKKLTGFINDNGTTNNLDDDILIIREKRFVDTLEPEYETGYAE